MPSQTQAGGYASIAHYLIAHYLKVLKSAGGNSHDGAAIVAKMKATPTEDALFGKG